MYIYSKMNKDIIYDKYTYGADGIRVYSWNEGTKLRIGKFCSIATNVQVFLGGNHYHQWVTTYPFGNMYTNIFTARKGNPSYSNGDVVIGNDVWVGANVTLMSGITIGDGAVIANNSHVVKNVEPYSIVGGNPAKLIRYRFTPEEIEALLKMKWWLWDDAKINENIHLMCSPNISEFIAKNM